MMKKILLLPFFMILLLGSALAQQSFAGKILGPGDVPLQGLTVSAADGALRTYTDGSGQFSLALPADQPRILLHVPGRKPAPLVLKAPAVLIRVAADGRVSQEPLASGN